MEKYIIILLFIIIFILLFERFQFPKKLKNKSIRNNTSKANKDVSSVVGVSNYVFDNELSKLRKETDKTKEQPTQQKPKEELSTSYIPAQIPEEDLENIFSEEINEDEEEELRAMRSPMEDENFAMGLSFDELSQIEPLLTKYDLSENEQKRATSIAQKLEDTEFLDKIEEILPQAKKRVSELLDRDLKSPPTKSEEDFDIGDFV